MDKQEKKLVDELRVKVHRTPDGKLIPLTDLKDLVCRAESTYCDRLASVDKVKKGKEKVVVNHTVREFAEKRQALGEALTQMGLKGKHVAIIGESSFQWILSFFTIVCGVGVAVPIDKELRDEEISALCSKADVEAVFCTRAYLGAAKLLLERDERCKYCVCMNYAPADDRILFFDDLLARGKALVDDGADGYRNAAVRPEDPCAIVFTSGTTGANKGVVLTHKNLCANVDNVIEIIPTEYSSFSLLPMNHVFELSCNIMTAFYMNAVIYVNDSLKNILENIQLFKPDAMNAVPLVLEGIYNGIWAAAAEQGKDKALKKLVAFSNRLRSHGIDLRHVLFISIRKKFGDKFPTLVCGGAPSRNAYVTGLGDFGFRVYNGYGLTETSPSVTLNMDAAADPTSAGYVVPRSEIKISEPDADGVGEIWVRGDNVFSEYYKDPEATAASFTDGWFKTGDYGRVTAEGELFVVGRKKTLIILDNGKNVFPEDVEFAVMDRTPYIKESCAFQSEKEISGKRCSIIVIGVYVAREDFAGLSDDQITQKVRDDILNDVNKQIPAYKRVGDVMVSFSEFEKTSTRKIVRQKVIDAYEASAARPQ